MDWDQPALWAEPPAGDRDGATYQRARDYDRLNTQAGAVWRAMKDGEWHTLYGLATATGFPEASISARLRDFRKDRFGSHVVERERDDHTPGLYWYRLRPGHRECPHHVPRHPAIPGRRAHVHGPADAGGPGRR